MASSTWVANRDRHRRGRQEEPETSLATLFLLSPTVGTLVAAWRGMKLLVTRWRERRQLERRAMGLRHRATAHPRHLCPACGFGVLRVLGDHRLNEYRRRSAGLVAREISAHDLRCDRPGCHHIAPRAGRAAQLA